MARQTVPSKEWLEARLDKSGPDWNGKGPCWNWTGARDQGYGRVRSEGQLRRAHLVIYEIRVGLVSQGLCLDHLCRNRACCNPDHLEPVTQKINILRGESNAAKNAQMTHCKRGHLLEGDNVYIWNNMRHCRTCANLRARARRLTKQGYVRPKRRSDRLLQRERLVTTEIHAEQERICT